MKHGRGPRLPAWSRGLLLAAGLFLPSALFLPGCDLPTSTALVGAPFGAGYTASSTFTVTDPGDDLRLVGSYQVDSGQLRVRVIGSDPAMSYEQTYRAPQTGRIEEQLPSAAGEWRLVVESIDGTGEFSLRIFY